MWYEYLYEMSQVWYQTGHRLVLLLEPKDPREPRVSEKKGRDVVYNIIKPFL